MQLIQLTQITQPTNDSVKLFFWERFYIATWTLEWEQINFESAEKVTFENKPSRANQEVEIWDVIFAKMQNTKKTLLITENEKEFIYSSWFFVLRPWKDILSWYLKHFLNSASFLEQKDKNCTGATQKALTLEWLQKIQIPLPPLSHQKQIIEKLDTLTNLINLRKLSIEKTEKLTKSIFIEMFWDPMINEKGWEVKRLEEVVIKLQAWKSLSWDDENIYKVLNTWSVSYDYFNWTDYKNLPKDYIPEEKNKVNIWDLLISRMNTEELVWAAAYVFNIWDNIYLPDRLWRVKSDKNIINNLFLWQYIIQPIFKKDIRQICSWTSWSMKNISMENFLSLKIFLPPISLQNKFASIVEKNEENIKKQKESLKKLEELYSWIMQESFRI